MKIAVVDDSKEFLDYMSTILDQIGFSNVKTFLSPEKLLNYLQVDEEVDVVLVDDSMPQIDGIELIKKIKETHPDIVVIMITSRDNHHLKEKAVDHGADGFFNKDNLSLPDLLTKIRIIKNLVTALKREKDLSAKLKEELKYKEMQEQLAIVKQKKIIKNELSMFFENDNLIETFYKPKDILNGDTVFSMRVDEDIYIMGIVDAMGKGLSASLTSVNATSFMEYSLKKAIEFNDFSFKRLVRDFVNYTKSILLENEMLSVIIINVYKDKLYYANFGMPPIYLIDGKIKSNNPSISVRMEDFKIDSVDLPDKFLVVSDGLIESPLKDKNIPYYAKFINFYKEIDFVKDLVEDFENSAIQKDDVSIVYFTKDKHSYDVIYEQKFEVSSKEDVDIILDKIYEANLPHIDRLLYILQELVMNTFEHTLYRMQTKKEYSSIEEAQKVKESAEILIRLSRRDDGKYIQLFYEEESEGFDLSILDELVFHKYHGKGIKIIKNLSRAVFYNVYGNKVKIYLKDKK